MKRFDSPADASRFGYWVFPLVGWGLFVFCAACGGLFDRPSLTHTLRVLADSATVPGVLLTGAALLSMAAARGTFALLAYAFHSFLAVLRRDASPVTYREFRDRPTGASPARALLAAGVGFLLAGCFLSVAFLFFA